MHRFKAFTELRRWIQIFGEDMVYSAKRGTSNVYSDSMERINTGFEHASRSIVPTRAVNMCVAGLNRGIKISAASGLKLGL
jgi:hypothetical protein